jgi:NAD+ kinase
MATVTEVKRALADSKVSVTRVRHKRDGFDASDFELVITVGGDGTLLHAGASVGETPVLGINSSPTTSVGFFCGATRQSAEKAIAQALAGKSRMTRLTRMRVVLNGDVVASRVLNDALFCHRIPAATSRYIVEHRGRIEEQKSSGIWVGPAAGSTAAQRSAGGRVLPLTSKNLQMVVREPYTPRGEPYGLRVVVVKADELLRVRSKSRQMRMYLDGPDNMVAVDLGDVIEFTQSPEPLCLLGISARRKWDA